MAKTRKRKAVQQQRQTNWLLVGGLIAAGLILFAVLLVLAVRPPEEASAFSLAEFCSENPANCAAIGPEIAPVTMVEVSDFGCPHCKDFHNQTAAPLKEQYVDTEQMRWLALPYALSPATVQAAAAAMCANEQDQYFAYANALFSQEDAETRLSPVGIRQAAEAIGLDLESFDSCVESNRYVRTVNRNQDAARDAGVTGTPTFFINDRTIRGAEPLATFQETIEGLLGQ